MEKNDVGGQPEKQLRLSRLPKPQRAASGKSNLGNMLYGAQPHAAWAGFGHTGLALSGAVQPISEKMKEGMHGQVFRASCQ